MNENNKMIANALSLRTPQRKSLDLLEQIVQKIDLKPDADLKEALAAIHEIAPKIEDFERKFPSVCFALATGVGKTRLMGAFIAYLHLEKGIKNFFVLAPNLTIYNKLIADFTPNTPKYVFPGIQEFAMNRPQVITGETYSQVGDLLDKTNQDRVKINIFNISKINSDKDSRGTPRVRAFSEYLGQSYFDYLASLDDLVIVMDEAHRYRASAGMKAINELKPVLGLELTATPKSTGSRGQRFKNIVYEYSLAEAIRDGYVKKPAIVGRSNFDTDRYTEEAINEIKIKDGLQIHETIKAELEVYSANHNVRKVKPFALIIARNIEHARELKALIDSDDFENGRYKGKVIEVDSQASGAEKDETIEKLLRVEKYDEPTEIVIHVDMLKEGWDVNNLYTIIPLKAADSKILVEQSIGRGLRLPFGECTGVDAIDRLNIIAHDKFQAIVKAAEDQQFEFQKIQLEENSVTGKVKAVDNVSLLEQQITRIISEQIVSPAEKKTSESTIEDKKATLETAPIQPALDVYKSNKVNEIASATLDVIEDFGKKVSSSKELATPENKAQLVEGVKAFLAAKTTEPSLQFDTEQVDIDKTVDAVVEQFINFNIDIPKVIVSFKFKEAGFTFGHFDADVSKFAELKAITQKILVKDLVSGKREEKGVAKFQKLYENLEDYVLEPLLNNLEVNYDTESELLYHLIGQVIEYLRSYAEDEEELEKILFFNGQYISDELLVQMKQHLIPGECEVATTVGSAYASLRTYKIIENEQFPVVSFRNKPQDKTKIKSMVFEGFEKCLFPKQKFDSDTERQLACLLEDTPDVLKWLKLNDDRAKSIFTLRYTDPDTRELKGYCPDFVIETTDAKYIVETKARDKMSDTAVLAKAKVAKQWCQTANDFESKHGGKNWIYLLVPDNMLFDATLTFEKLTSICIVRE